MRQSKAARVIRGGLWLYLVSVTNNVFGFLYWLIISRIGGAEILGFTSASIGLASLVNGAVSLGVPMGMRRFLGASLKDRKGFSLYLSASLTLLAALQGGAAAVLLALSILGISVGSFTPAMLRVAALLVLLGISAGFTSLLVSTLRTDRLAIANLLGNVAKLGLGIALVEAGLGWVGAAVAYAAIPIAITAAGALYAAREGLLTPVIDWGRALEVLRAGLAVWVPGVVVLVGQQLAVLTIFSARGAVETGRFYIAFTIAGFVSGVAMSMIQLLLPVLSGMESGRVGMSLGVARLGMVFVAPVAAAIALYPQLPLALLGRGYVEASNVLALLSLTVLLAIPGASLSNLLYSYGDYRRVLAAGLAQSIPRVLLYAALVPLYGGLGAAAAYAVGTAAWLGYLAYVSRGLLVGRAEVREIAVAAALPLAVSTALFLARAPPLVGIPVVALSYLAYARLRVVTRRDLALVSTAILGARAESLYRVFKPLVDALVPG